jgi:alkylated DNA nucleotide flippase Atl1
LYGIDKDSVKKIWASVGCAAAVIISKVTPWLSVVSRKGAIQKMEYNKEIKNRLKRIEGQKLKGFLV